MPDVIDFLERMGQDASLRHAPQAELDQALRNAQIDPRVRAALMRGDQAEIEGHLGLNNVCCMVYVPTPEAEEEFDETRRRQAA